MCLIKDGDIGLEDYPYQSELQIYQSIPSLPSKAILDQEKRVRNRIMAPIRQNLIEMNEFIQNVDAKIQNNKNIQNMRI